MNESELQALLHHFLLSKFRETPPLTLHADVVNPREGAEYTCRRVYRGMMINKGFEPAGSANRAALIVMKDSEQTLLAKDNGAPTRFLTPYAAIIEVQINGTLNDIQKKIDRWEGPEYAHSVFGVLCTSKPEKFEDDPRILSIKCPALKNRTEQVYASVPASILRSMYELVINNVHRNFKLQPFWYIRELDFESDIFCALRTKIGPTGTGTSPVRAQWASEHKSIIIGKSRTHDIVILSANGILDLEIELKVSHSKNYRIFDKPVAIREFCNMQKLIKKEKINQAVFLVFRLGTKSDGDQTDEGDKQKEFPDVEIDYRCSD
ncbi:MAG: hypothetical protein HOL54_15580 [Rhodospirillales bacterium]|nr:hypothetical protein [Rhodospirillales bacterium]